MRARLALCGLFGVSLGLLPVTAVRAEAPARLSIDGGLALSLPAALPTGLMAGVGGGVMRGAGLAWGARASLASATEFTPTWIVRHDELKLRAQGALRRRAGRGTFALRLGLGGTLVHELRTRNQGARAGLTGDALEDRRFRLLPGVELELSVTLVVRACWAVVVSGGPSVHVDEAALSPGWTGALGVAWQR